MNLIDAGGPISGFFACMNHAFSKSLNQAPMDHHSESLNPLVLLKCKNR